MCLTLPTRILAALLTAGGLGLAAPAARADFVINFDALAAHGVPGGVVGPPLADYLAGYGVSLTDVTPGTEVVVYDARDIYADIQPVVPPSPFNVIAQQGSLDPISYTLTFAVPQDFFRLTRPYIRAGDTGVALPAWAAYAYDSSGNLLDSVGEDAFSIFSDLPAQQFSLNGPNIDHVTIASDNGHFAAFGSVILDDFTLSAVPTATTPEPGSLVLAGVGAVGVAAARRRAR
ncbi:MAG: PEP-CTERM sorting domain-containing protein, partial [Gemmataceae bacterium]|nr:PEP-CTERM sorting domain-containing protein [Gemmataceae bacterium]